MKEYIFTFGSGHRPYGNHYTIVEAPDEFTARSYMHDITGGAYCTSYPSKEAAGVDVYGIKFVELATVRQNPPCWSACGPNPKGRWAHVIHCKHYKGAASGQRISH